MTLWSNNAGGGWKLSEGLSRASPFAADEVLEERNGYSHKGERLRARIRAESAKCK